MFFMKYFSKETRKKLSNSRKNIKKEFGYLNSAETREKMSLAKIGKPSNMTGKKHSEETKKKMSIRRKVSMIGNKNSWIDGRTSVNAKIRNSEEYKNWRSEVFKRDKWTCGICKKRGVRINADHIKPFAHFPELRLNIENGRTLCVDCHKNTETFGGTGGKHLFL